jgi:hypothetical protein
MSQIASMEYKKNTAQKIETNKLSESRIIVNTRVKTKETAAP